jgi:hypothetical protein
VRCLRSWHRRFTTFPMYSGARRCAWCGRGGCTKPSSLPVLHDAPSAMACQLVLPLAPPGSMQSSMHRRPYTDVVVVHRLQIEEAMLVENQCGPMAHGEDVRQLLLRCNPQARLHLAHYQRKVARGREPDAVL